MEILNHNQRKSAKWRVSFIGLAVLGILGLSVSSIHKSYAGGGADELERLKKDFEEKEKTWKGKNQDLLNENKDLKVKIIDCKKKTGEPNEELAKLQKEMRVKEELNEKRLNLAKEELAACKSKSTN